jgi:glucokinase
LIRRGIGQGRKSLVDDLSGGNPAAITVPLVVEAAQAGDRLSLEALETVGHHLGIGIASLVNALNPELVVFGGSLSLASEFLMPVVEYELERRALRWIRRATRVVITQHGLDACVMGGVARVFQVILAEPVKLPQTNPGVFTIAG